MQPTLTTSNLTTTNLTTNDVVAAGVAGGMFATIMIILLVWGILGLIAGWKIFEKAGERGWKVLIPIYDVYIFFKIVGMKAWFWVSFLITLVASIAMAAMGFDPSKIDANSFSGNTLVPALIYVAEMVFMLIVSIVYCVRLAKVFGHGIGYTLGLILFPGIFMMIIAFGKSKYDKKLAHAWNV